MPGPRAPKGRSRSPIAVESGACAIRKGATSSSRRLRGSEPHVGSSRLLRLRARPRRLSLSLSLSRARARRRRTRRLSNSTNRLCSCRIEFG
ncbi:hypothetical protein BDA96_03G453400 [Sorghum bicolor]|uniref:Uncharacterized protein n=1 Tax=Sorghum bicolor TaxID=4558 RepID=A0A921RIJ7_SORBI|nr:hypothetical protein BDA96_03G453400 [Sorghum bicolor]